jgi:pimeloyl-ACP methyl ester carboxylesterase
MAIRWMNWARLCVCVALVLVIAAPATSADAIQHVVINGTDLAWVEQGSGIPVVFVHGSGADLRTWGHQLPAVARASFRAIAYSRRYHHPNPPPAPDSRYVATVHADDLGAFIESLHAGAVHIVASSYGGAVALLLARERPALVRSLFLTEPAILSLLAPGSPEEAQAAELQRARDLMARGDSEPAIRAFIDVIIGPGMYALMPASTHQMLGDNVSELRLEAIATPADEPRFTCEDARQVKAPAMLVTGGASPTFFKAIDTRLAECLPSVEAVTVPGAAHAVHAQQTARFNELLLGFLEKHRQ